MFTQRTPVFSLATVLAEPQNFSFSGNGSFGVENTYDVTTKTYGKGKLRIASLHDFTTKSFNILKLCELWHHHNPTAGHFIIPSLIHDFFFRLKQESNKKAYYLRQFFADISYQQLHAINADVAKSLMRVLFDWDIMSRPEQARYQGLDKPPRILVEYADHVAHTLTTVPQVLLQEFDPVAAASACSYQSMSVKHPGSKIEGCWQGGQPRVNDTIVKAADERLATNNNKLDAFDLQQLKDMVLDLEHPNEQHFYPIPEPLEWPHNDNLLRCLKALQEMSLPYAGEMRALLALRVTDESILDNLLMLNINYDSYSMYTPQFLPIGNISHREYTIKMPDESRLTWVSGLTDYMEKYNVVPSLEFLAEFGNLLNYCRSNYLEGARALTQYLNNHPLRLESEESRSSMRI